MRTLSTPRILGILSIAVAGSGAAQTPIEARYAKTEVQIPMRDGTRLFTAVYQPRDTTRRYAILLTRTPYSVGPYGPTAYPRSLGPSPRFADDGFVFVYQDVRGRYMSEGDFVHMTPWRGMAGARATDESTDTYDTIDWLLKNVPRNTGRVGIWGISYPGFFTAAALVNAHPALAAASPQAPQADWFLGDDVHHHGAFLLASAFEFFATSGRARPKPTTEHPGRFDFGTDDGYAFFLAMGPLANADRMYLKGAAPFWNDMMAHGTDDAFWEARRVAPHLEKVTPAVLTVSGWYDANNLHGALLVHDAIARQSPATSNRIALGPWSHGQWSRGTGDALGDLRFGSSTSQYFRDSIEYPFFKHYLEGRVLSLAPASAFETGSNRWRTFDSWPPRAATPRALYLHAGGALSLVAPLGKEGEGFDQYVSDPASPVPFLERHNTGMKPDYMAYDQRFTSTRPDVLVYQTEPLASDLTIAGSVRPTLYVSTSGTDSDWIVKLIDVHPDSAAGDQTTDASRGGFEELVRGDVMRGKFRNSYSRPEAFTPGKVERVTFGMDDVLHTFKKGHRIMLHVQSSWFPLVDRNPQKFVDIYNVKEADFTKATERVYRSAAQASRVDLPVLP
ncbi:MAG TPA: CocE/NonD family hydrolase [Gemmatimonadaceae bacterium]|nr:CocE/NonD family hydrolase [Gemmatimonadaceae bacterium]